MAAKRRQVWMCERQMKVTSPDTGVYAFTPIRFMSPFKDPQSLKKMSEHARSTLISPQLMNTTEWANEPQALYVMWPNAPAKIYNDLLEILK